MDTNPQAEVADPVEDLLSALNDTPEQDEPESATEDEAAEETSDEAPAEEVEPDQPATDEEDLELDGDTFKVPKKIAEAVMRQKDYTQKTQAVAEEKRAVEDKRQYLEAREHLLSTSFKDAAELQATQNELAKYDAVDWNTLIAEDPQQAMRLSLARQQLQAALAEKQQSLQKASAQIEAARKQHQAKQAELGQAELERRIGKVKDADKARLMAAAKELGFEAEDMWNPRALHALHLASKYLALQAAKPQAMKKVAEAPRVIKTQAPTPVRQQQNKAALDRLKTTGRASELIKFL